MSVAIAGAFSAVTPAQQPVFRSGIKLIETTVVVHDGSGQPVTDLQQSEFKIFEDGKEQKLQVFAVETDEPRPPSSPMSPSFAPNVFSNREQQRRAGAVSVVLFDRLNSTFEDQKQARDQIVEYFTTIRPEDRVAFYVLEGEAVTVLHDFTSDASRLIAAARRYVANTSIEWAGSTEKPADFAPSGDAVEDADTAAWLARMQEAVSETFLRRRAQLSLDALEGIARHLAGVPGRKNLVWVSGAFPVVIPGEHGPTILNREISRAARAISDANVTIYPVDIRGLIGAFVNPSAATATTVGRGTGAGSQVFTTLATTHPNQDSMRDLAEATGGRVFLNSNAIGEQVRRAIDDGRVSYVLGYYSPRVEADRKFHKIDVKVSRKDVDVRHRSGYLSLPAPAIQEPRTRLAALERIMASPVPASEIEVVAQLDRRGASDALLSVRLDPAGITWHANKDVREGAIDVMIAQSEPGGRFFTLKETTVNLSADAERYRQMSAEGFTLTLNVTLRPTAYRLHVVVSDVATQAVGSLIIPIQGR